MGAEDLISDDTSDWSLTEKLRLEDPEQFQILVRMHLSFVLDLNTDETDGSTEEKAKFRPLKWSLTSFSKKLKNSKGALEELPLNEVIISQIYQLIDFLSIEDNIIQEGIFRKSGSTSRQQELKNSLHQGNIIDFSSGQFSVHDCASVLKCILAELPEPLLTEVYYPAYCQISEFCSDSPSEQISCRLLKSIQLLLMLLPVNNHKLFKKIIYLLHLTANHENTNKMSSNNLATLFTPHLLCPKKLSPEALHTNAAILSKIVVFMIDHGSALFDVPVTLATDVKAYWAKKEKKLKSPVKDVELGINESIMDSSAVNTVFTFVDREKTAQENTVNATEAALAQLYAYIQSLPESSKKRRLVKQFNKENGHGTPAMVAKQTPVMANSSSKKFSDSIKRHIFHRSVKHSSKPNSMVKTKLETMLTPRSRKPVVALSGTNLCHLADLSNTFQSPLLLPITQDDLKPATIDLSITSDGSHSDSVVNENSFTTDSCQKTESNLNEDIESENSESNRNILTWHSASSIKKNSNETTDGEDNIIRWRPRSNPRTKTNTLLFETLEENETIIKWGSDDSKTSDNSSLDNIEDKTNDNICSDFDSARSHSSDFDSTCDNPNDSAESKVVTGSRKRNSSTNDSNDNIKKCLLEADVPCVSETAL